MPVGVSSIQFPELLPLPLSLTLLSARHLAAPGCRHLERFPERSPGPTPSLPAVPYAAPAPLPSLLGFRVSSPSESPLMSQELEGDQLPRSAGNAPSSARGQHPNPCLSSCPHCDPAHCPAQGSPCSSGKGTCYMNTTIPSSTRMPSALCDSEGLGTERWNVSCWSRG